MLWIYYAVILRFWFGLLWFDFGFIDCVAFCCCFVYGCLFGLRGFCFVCFVCLFCLFCFTVVFVFFVWCKLVCFSDLICLVPAGLGCCLLCVLVFCFLVCVWFWFGCGGLLFGFDCVTLVWFGFRCWFVACLFSLSLVLFYVLMLIVVFCWLVCLLSAWFWLLVLWSVGMLYVLIVDWFRYFVCAIWCGLCFWFAGLGGGVAVCCLLFCFLVVHFWCSFAIVFWFCDLCASVWVCTCAFVCCFPPCVLCYVVCAVLRFLLVVLWVFVAWDFAVVAFRCFFGLSLMFDSC